MKFLNLHKQKAEGVLMALSMLLLTIFLVFWVQKEYQEQKSIVKKEANILFENSVQALEDSIFQSKINALEPKIVSAEKPENKDRLEAKKIVKGVWRQSSKPSEYLKNMMGDSLKVEVFEQLDSMIALKKNLADKGIELKKFEIKVSSESKDSIYGGLSSQMSISLQSNNPDSAKIMMGKMLNSLRKKVNNDKSQKTISIKNRIKSIEAHSSKNAVILKLSNDTIPLKKLSQQFKKRLNDARLSIDFNVLREYKYVDSLDNQVNSTNAVSSSMPMGSFYRAQLRDTESFVFKKIVPQLLFSLFLLAVTGLSFALIYRNLQRQRRLIALKNDFISNMTHELKTPIATVSVAIEALQNFGVTNNPAQTQEYLSISKNELNRLSILVDKVLKMNSFDHQGLQLNHEEIVLQNLVQEVLDSMKLQFDKHKANVTLDVANENAIVWGDRVHLTNVVMNLIDNALKYCSQKPNIDITIAQANDRTMLTIADNGIGIEAAYKDKVFDKFFRVPTGNTHNVKGYGLGLNYVANVVQQHGGSIALESEIEQGSRFSILLPTTQI